MVVKDSYDDVIVIDVILGIFYERDGDWWSNWFLIASRPDGQMKTMMMMVMVVVTLLLMILMMMMLIVIMMGMIILWKLIIVMS